MNNILIMLSGGIDSTHSLWYYLEHTKLPIYIHHIVLKSNIEIRHNQEATATEAIVEWAKTNYPGRIKRFIKSLWWMNPNFEGMDIELTLFVGATVARRIEGITAVAVGSNLEDGRTTRMIMAIDIWKLYAKTYEGLDPEVLEIGAFTPKAVLAKQLPKELLDLTWSCRSSINNKQCGRCHACKLNKGINIEKL